MINRKTNSLLVEKYGDYAHLYLYLEEVQLEDTTEWEGPLVVMKTTLDTLQLEGYREALIKFAPAVSTKEGALNYLAKTDYTVVKCIELGLDIKKEYIDVYNTREVAREIIRLES